jgi:Family of unknown function (DUF6131)
MIILGLILLIVGFVMKIAIVWTIGILGATGHAVGGRRHYW